MIAPSQEAVNRVVKQRTTCPKGHFLGLWAPGAAWWCRVCRKLFDSEAVAVAH